MCLKKIPQYNVDDFKINLLGEYEAIPVCKPALAREAGGP
jgi:hypothetical protein